MNGLPHPIIHRKRQSLEPAIVVAVPAGVTVCPHCGRSSAEPVVPAAEQPKVTDAKTIHQNESE